MSPGVKWNPGDRVLVISGGQPVYPEGGTVTEPRSTREYAAVERSLDEGRERVWVDWDENARTLEYADKLSPEKPVDRHEVARAGRYPDGRELCLRLGCTLPLGHDGEHDPLALMSPET